MLSVVYCTAVIIELRKIMDMMVRWYSEGNKYNILKLYIILYCTVLYWPVNFLIKYCGVLHKQ
jgi:hypothetical protein